MDSKKKRGGGNKKGWVKTEKNQKQCRVDRCCCSSADNKSKWRQTKQNPPTSRFSAESIYYRISWHFGNSTQAPLSPLKTFPPRPAYHYMYILQIAASSSNHLIIYSFAFIIIPEILTRETGWKAANPIKQIGAWSRRLSYLSSSSLACSFSSLVSSVPLSSLRFFKYCY